MESHDTPREDDEILIAVGRFGRAHGVQGEVRLFSYNDDSALYEHDRIQGWIEDSEAPTGRRPITITSWRPADRFLIVRVEGVRYRDQAETLNNREIFVDRDMLPEPDEDELYLIDTVGWLVSLRHGESTRPIGHIKGYIETGANDVMRIALADHSELLAPMIDEVVEILDPVEQRAQIAPLEQWAAPDQPEPPTLAEQIQEPS